MTLNEIEQDCYRRLGFNTTTPDPATQTRIRAFINETQQEILSEPVLAALLTGQAQFASVAATPTYAIPPAAARVKALYETTNDRKLIARSLDWYRALLPDVTVATGTPTDYVDLGFVGVHTQPSDSSSIFVVSSSASDVGIAYLEGWNSSGHPLTASVTMTGVTAVAVGVNAFAFITKFYLSTPALGTVSLTEDSGAGTALARIFVQNTYSRYRKVALVPTPASVITYTVDFDWDARSMSVATDEPLLPPRFHRLLAVGARMKEYEKQDDRRYGATEAEYARGMRQLTFFVSSQTAGTPNLRGLQTSGYSRLGGQYPAGS